MHSPWKKYVSICNAHGNQLFYCSKNFLFFDKQKGQKTKQTKQPNLTGTGQRPDHKQQL